MLRVHARVSPPFRPVPRPEQAKQEIYRQTRNGRTGIKRGGDNVYKVLVECGPALCDVAVGEDGDGGAGEDDVGGAGCEQVRERRAERGARSERAEVVADDKVERRRDLLLRNERGARTNDRKHDLSIS